MHTASNRRLNPQRYRLQGVRYENGEMSLQNRPDAPLIFARPIIEQAANRQSENIEGGKRRKENAA